jgi:hypothetical protein
MAFKVSELGDSDEEIGEYMFTPEEESLRQRLLALAEAERRKKQEAADEAKAREEAIAAETNKKLWQQYEVAKAKEDQARHEEETRAQAAEQQRRREQEAVDTARLAEQMRLEAEKYHEWRSVDSDVPFRARIVSFGNGVVTVETSSQVRSKLKIQTLNADDRNFVEQWRRERQ